MLYLAGLILFAAGFFFAGSAFLKALLFGSAYLIFGGPVLLTAARNLVRGKVFDENFLMAIATLGAFVIGEYPEGVAVMIFYQLGELLQDNAVDRSRRSIESLVNIRPDYANLYQFNTTKKVDPAQVHPGELIIVRPGERIPLDGVVLKGCSSLDLSALTGEALPQDVAQGDEVLSGSVNLGGLLTVQVVSAYKESTVARILALVENAAAHKARTEEFITRFAAYYTPAVVFSALAIAFLPPMLLSGEELFSWVYRALVFLVISCPCALVISIPLGIFGGIGGASKRGILVKGGNYLEALGRAETVIFDKTGTLTEGRYVVEEVKPAAGFTAEELQNLAVLAARHSSHPVARAILNSYPGSVQEENLSDYHEEPGLGVRVNDHGRQVVMGNLKMLKSELKDDDLSEENETAVYLAVQGRYAGSITFSDQLKEDAVSAVEGLRQLGVKKIIMLSGDKLQVAEKVGHRLGLDQVHAGLLPDQKIEAIARLEEENSGKAGVVFVGDGINDAPALARAKIGVAMGKGAADAAVEAADIVLMAGRPSKLVEVIGIARKTNSIVRQNVVLALGIKGLIMALSLMGFASMWLAVFADVGVALLATLNATRAFYQ